MDRCRVKETTGGSSPRVKLFINGRHQVRACARACVSFTPGNVRPRSSRIPVPTRRLSSEPRDGRVHRRRRLPGTGLGEPASWPGGSARGPRPSWKRAADTEETRRRRFASAFSERPPPPLKLHQLGVSVSHHFPFKPPTSGTAMC